MEIKQKIRTRVAPSPTGNLHVGTAQSALYNWLFARHHGGEFILRSEDTDEKRSKPEFEKNILENLEWLGLKWDEFYRSSERADRYEKHLQKLLDGKKAFWCYHAKEELEKEKEEQMQKKEAPRHICSHKYEEPVGKEKQIIRLAVDENSTRIIRFEDLIRGPIEFEQKVVGDLSLAKDLKTALYNFAVAVDDYEMNISHVIRGEDHISNTPKQILIFEALGASVPQFVHLPLLLGTDRSKLSKRHAVTSVEQYRQAGYFAEAMVNFLAILGWTPKGDREILTKNEIIEQFKLEGVHKSGAVFDIKKLNWVNSRYIKMFNDQGLAEAAKPFIDKYFGEQPLELIIKISPLLRERLEYFDQVKEFKFFFTEPEYEPDLLTWKKSDQTGAKKALELIKKVLESKMEWEVFDETYLRTELDQLAEKEFHGDRGAVFWPLRAALSGEKFSPDPVQIMAILGQNATFSRIEKALLKL